MFDLDRLKAKLIFAKNTTFFTQMLYALDCHIDETVNTACTDGTCIKFNPHFMGAKSDADQLFVLLHEICHVAFNHVTRIGTKCPKKWGKACDYWVNHYLEAQGYKVPCDGLYDEDYPHTLAVDVIYDRLPDEEDEDNNGGGAGDPLAGDIQPDPSMTQQELQELETKIGDATVRAAIATEQAKEYGTLPGEFVRMMEEFLNPLVPWNVVLANYLADIAKDDYSWSRRNRRYEDVYLPSMYSEGMGRITVYVDCSISVTQEEFQQEMGEVKSIKDCFNPAELVVVFFNSEIVSEQTFYRDEEVDVELPKDGGTRIEPVFDHIIEHPSDVVVIFTDGYFRHDIRVPVSPVFWCIVNNKNFESHVGQILTVEV